MVSRIFAIFALSLLLVSAAPKKNIGRARGENQDLTLDVTVYLDGDAIKEVLGDDLGGHFIVAKVVVEPKYGKEIAIDRDDFMLRTDKDGDRSKPMAPSQIAGRGALVITSTRGPSGEGAEPTRGWSMGGIGIGGGGAGTGGADPKSVKATMEKGSDTESPLKKILDGKVLPEKKTTQPLEGLLFFPLEKQRLKDLELIYGGRENRIGLRFKP
jgi:hypothetical protein